MNHQVIDERSLELHRAVSAKLCRCPELMEKVRSNLVRYRSIPGRSVASLRCDQEWQNIIDTKSLDEVVSILTEVSEEGQRLRQSTPFSGILSEKERLRIFRKYESCGV